MGLISFAAGVPGSRRPSELPGDIQAEWKPIRFSWQGLHGHKTIAHGNGLEGDTVETGRPIFSKNGAATELPVKVTGTKSALHFGSDFGHREYDCGRNAEYSQRN